MSPVADPIALIARVRAALRYDGERAAHAEVRARGTGTVGGLPAILTWRCHVDGRSRLEIASALPQASAFDGVRGTHVGPSGVLEPLDLEDVDELRIASALFTGTWLDPMTPFLFAHAASEGDTVVFGLRAGPERWHQPFRIVCAAGSFLPKRLEMLSGDAGVFEVDGFAPGVFCDVPRRLRWRRGWLADTVEISHVELVTDMCSFVLQDARGDRAARVDPSAPTRARVTRSPRGRLPLARVSIDGRDVGWFLLDTGAGMSAIEADVADDLGLPGLGRTWIVTPTGGMGASYRRCGALCVGPVTLPEALFVELDLRSISTALGVRLAGIFGFDLFAQTVVRVVHEPLVVELFSFGHDYPTEWRDVRFQDRVPALEAVLAPGEDAGSSGLVVLDTGSSAPVVLHERIALQLGLKPTTARRGVRGVSGAAYFGAHALSWIDVGGERFERVRALVSDSTEGALATPTTLGSVGWGLFAGRELILDWPRRRMAILAVRGVHGRS
jgi:predicted aspartyl protease